MQQRRSAGVLVLTIGLVVVVAGCGGGSATVGTAPLGRSSTGARPTLGTDGTQAANNRENNDEKNEEGYESPAPAAAWNEAAGRGAREAGTTAMRRFARPQLSAAAWWKGIRPLLTPGAAAAFENTDPASVPVHQVRGRASVRSAGSAYLAEVMLATDAGSYSVLLVRAGAGREWLVEDIRPPQRTSR